MSNEEIKYITYDEVLDVYAKTIKYSGGGLSGVLDSGKIASIIAFVQHDDYYPDFVTKLNYLVYRFCSGHCFQDGNKRIALTIGAYFLHKNGYNWQAVTFMKRIEAIIYHIAASHIDEELSIRIMTCIMSCDDFDEGLKIDIANAMSQGELFNDNEEQKGEEDE